MKRFMHFVCKVFLVITISVGQAMATEVSFGSNVTVDEGAGVAWIQISRTGDLSGASVVTFEELWSDSRTEATTADLSFNWYSAPSNVSFYTYIGNVTFHSGDSVVQIPYSITDDQETEVSEDLYFKLRNASTGTTIIDNEVRIRITDNEPQVVTPFVGIYPGTITDEGNETRSLLVLSEPTNHNVTLRVSSYSDTYYEANYPVQDDYRNIDSVSFTIPAGIDMAWVPIQTYQNNDPNDAMYEDFELCIDSGSVSGAIVNAQCAKLVIKDVPLPTPTAVSSVVFKDAIGSGWTDTSWGVSSDLQAIAYAGAYGLEASYIYAWAGLSFSSDGFDTSGYDTLSFAIKDSSSNSGEEVYVVVYRANGSVQSRPLSSHLTNGSLVSGVWNEVHIPLTDLGATNALVNRVVFESGQTGLLFVDDLSFLTYSGECE